MAYVIYGNFAQHIVYRVRCIFVFTYDRIDAPCLGILCTKLR